MPYIFDLESGAPRYLDPGLERLLSPGGKKFDFIDFRQKLSEADTAVLAAHIKRLHELPPGETADMVIAVGQSGLEACWLHFRSRLLKRPDDATRQMVGAAVEVDPGHAPRLIHDLERRIINAEEAERRRIGRELHDSTIQHLVAIDLLLGSLEAQPATPVPGVIQEMRDTLSAVQNEMRTFAFLLHPPNVDEQGLEQTLRRFCEGFARRTGLVVRTDFRLAQAYLPFDAEVALFRIAQEAFMNVHRHAAASEVFLRLVASPRHVTLEVSDDGRGMNSVELAEAMRGSGVGVAGMKARIISLGGSLQLESNGFGVSVRARLPRRSRRM